MREVMFNHPGVGPYVAERAGCAFNADSDNTIGVVDYSAPPGQFIQGGVIFTSYTGSSCFLHVAGRNEKWITHDMLWATFDYPFVQLGCGIIYGIVREDDTHTLKFDLRIGFRELYRSPGMFPSGAGVLLGMERAECRWLKMRPRTISAGGQDGR